MISLAIFYRALVVDTLDPVFLRRASGFGEYAPFLFLGLVVLNLVAGFQALGTLMAVGLDHAAGRRREAVDARSLGGAAAVGGLGALASYLGLVMSFHSGAPPGRRLFWPPDLLFRSLALGRAGGLIRNLRRTPSLRRVASCLTVGLSLASSSASPRRPSPIPSLGRRRELLDSWRFRPRGWRRAASQLSTIVGPDGDAHVYEPTPGDGRKLAGARLVFVNGLGFEGWIDRLIAASKTKAKIVTVSAGVAPRHLDEGLDPHAWQDVANAKRYIENIRDALVAADPSRAKMFEANAAAYLAKLDGLDREVVAAVAAIPAERRRIVSTHDAFGYFPARMA